MVIFIIKNRKWTNAKFKGSFDTVNEDYKGIIIFIIENKKWNKMKLEGAWVFKISINRCIWIINILKIYSPASPKILGKKIPKNTYSNSFPFFLSFFFFFFLNFQHIYIYIYHKFPLLKNKKPLLNRLDAVPLWTISQWATTYK